MGRSQVAPRAWTGKGPGRSAKGCGTPRHPAPFDLRAQCAILGPCPHSSADRAPDFGSGGRGFESCWGCQLLVSRYSCDFGRFSSHAARCEPRSRRPAVFGGWRRPGAASDFEVAWQYVSSVVENADVFVLFFGSSQDFLVVPKRAFAGMEQVDAFRAAANSR